MRLSYSSMQPTCWRAFQLRKLKETDSYAQLDETSHTMYGHAWGDGVATLLRTRSLEQAILASLRAWKPALAESPKRLETCFSGLIQLEEKFDWTAYTDVGLHGEEAGIRIWFDEARTDYWLFYLDQVLVNSKGELVAVEVKSTNRQQTITELYGNSPQSLIGSLVLRYLFPEYPAQWESLYIVNYVKNVHTPEIEILGIRYQASDRLAGLLTMLLEYEQIQRMREIEFFPKSGQCVQFGRTCEYFGDCDMLALMAPNKALAAQNEIPWRDKPLIDIQFSDLLAQEGVQL